MKLTKKEANDLILQASKESGKGSCLRFGQALWNRLPTRISQEYVATDKDFFYEKDNVVVMQKFEHFIEETLD